MGLIIDEKPKEGGFMGFLEKISPIVPIVGGIAQNILSGINERKARLYNRPAEQVRRLNEAGLPKSAASNISAGGGAVVTSPLGTEQYNQNLSSSITRQVDRKRLDILKQELRVQQAMADEREGEVRNKLNPLGKFEPTNQGTSAMQALEAQALANKTAGESLETQRTINKWMPTEKFQNVLKNTKEIEQIAANTKNTIAQHGIILADSKIKNILANYQERMSLNELENLIRRNTGISKDNDLKSIAISLEWQTLMSKVTVARNAALTSGYQSEAARLNNLLTTMSMPSTQAYYTVRSRIDKEASGNTKLFRAIGDLVYLGMFQPNTSNYNLGNMVPNIHGGNSYQTHQYFPSQK